MSSKRVRILKRRKTRYIHDVKMSIKRKELLCGFDVVFTPGYIKGRKVHVFEKSIFQ